MHPTSSLEEGLEEANRGKFLCYSITLRPLLGMILKLLLEQMVIKRLATRKYFYYLKWLWALEIVGILS